MHTSYYASKKLNSSMNLIAISRSVPKFMKGNITVYRPLCPPWDLISAYKEGRITDARYEHDYHANILSGLDPEMVYQALGEDAVLLCWEAPDKFCHRHIVASWLNDALNIGITEL